MKRTLEEYREDAVAIHNSSFHPREKARHCHELLAHMRAQYGSSLRVNEEASQIYQMIQSMINNV